MGLKAFKPTSPGRRGLVLVSREGLWRGKPVKRLTRGLSSSGGRNNLGRMTVRRRGGGHKRAYRMVDFHRRRFGEQAVVERLEYDPNRSAFLALVRYEEDGSQSYILAPHGLEAGSKVVSGLEGVDVVVGNAMPLGSMPVGTVVHNLEMKPGKGAQLVRSAGASAQLLGHGGGYAIVRLASGEQRMVQSKCMATVGVVSNADHSNRKLAKAGRSRWMGRRPKVRGVAMNPVDHPHGGGEGKSSGGRHPVTPWGKHTKGHRTRNNKSTDRFILRSRRRGKR